MVDHIWEEKGSHLFLREVEISDGEEPWSIRRALRNQRICWVTVTSC